MRKIPSQARGRDRVDRILLAAAEEFAAKGFDATTTSAIAARAGTSIGSVYQFFEDKSSIVDALVERYRADLSEIAVGGVHPDHPTGEGPDLAEALDPVVDRLVAYGRANQAFPTLLSLGSNGALHPTGGGVRHALQDVVSRILSAKNDDPVAVERMSGVLTAIVAGLLPSAVGSDDLVPHLKAAMVGYLVQVTSSTQDRWPGSAFPTATRPAEHHGGLTSRPREARLDLGSTRE
ncbi:TetR/AcrR family transcriptional regulator [Pseudonocardia aurantiaca]|uniref:TetR/AcrR family transcriptional regulator n=1 Tax=Pseudonocardia aurantiaca TaxID=75290 RepID=A0ABW4FUA6_9PSEU